MRTRDTRRFTTLIGLALAASLSGCITLSNYSATCYEQLTQLKAYHLKFVDDFTTETPTPVDKGRVETQASAGHLKFREAEEYAAGMKDQSRTINIEALHALFTGDVALLEEGKTFSKKYAEERKDKQLVPSYDRAIEGEKVRPER